MGYNSYYGSDYYGSYYYGGDPSSNQFIHGTVLLNVEVGKYLHGRVALLVETGKYITGDADLVYENNKYIHGSFALLGLYNKYIAGKVSFIYGLLPYEVDEFQIIVSRQGVKFYWEDSITSSSTKTYSLYDSIDEGKTWALLITTTDTEYELDKVPYNIAKKVYKVIISLGSLVSYGFISYPVYSFRRTLDELDNGYWDISPETNTYKLYEGIEKESFCRAELEALYTEDDFSVINVRNSRISEIWGSVFDQESASADEDYKRKIWNLLIGFRNTPTYKGAYYVTKAFTNIPPKINKLSEDGWILGTRYLSIGTIPLSTLTALYGASFKIHLPSKISADVVAVPDLTSIFDSTSTEGLNTISNYYQDDYLVFKLGNNANKSRKILQYSYSGGVGRFTTQEFPSDTTVGDVFFVAKTPTDVIEDAIRKETNLHAYLFYKYYANYATENHETGFAGTLSNLELVQGRRLRVTDIDRSTNDGGKEIQAVYDSGTGFSRAYPLSSFGSIGTVCWDHIIWGDADIDFKVYVTYTNDLSSNDWVYQEDKETNITFSGVQESILDEYIKDESDTVYDSSAVYYVRNIDYTINYREGTIKRTFISSIPTTTFVTVKYNLEWGEVVQNQQLTFTKNYMKYRFTVDGVRATKDFEFSGFYLKKYT